MDYIQFTDKGAYILLYIQPGAKKTQIVGVHDGALKVRINAPAIDGKANKALVKFLSKTLSLPLAQIHVTKGLSSRKKTVFVESLSENSKAVQSLAVI